MEEHGKRNSSESLEVHPTKRTRLRRSTRVADLVDNQNQLQTQSNDSLPPVSSEITRANGESPANEPSAFPSPSSEDSNDQDHNGDKQNYLQSNVYDNDSLEGENSEEDIFKDLLKLSSELNLFEPIYPKSKVKLIDALIKITSLFKRYKMSKTELNEWLDHVTELLPENNIYPKSYDEFETLTKKLLPKLENPEVLYYCASCLHKFGTKRDVINCANCDSDISAVYVKNNVEANIRHMLENRGLAKLLENQYGYLSKPDGIISDITDGSICKSISKKSIYDMNLIQNTDGFPCGNSKNKQIWPNYILITEVKPQLRSHYMVLAGLWFSPIKVNLITFLTPFTIEMRSLSLNGFTWTHPTTKSTIVSRLDVVASTLDAEVRSGALSLNFHNSNFGCAFCEIPGSQAKKNPLAKSKNSVFVYPYQTDPAPSRKNEQVLAYAKKMYEMKCAKNIEAPNDIMGVKGLSSFAMLPNFDLVNSNSPNVLHSCYIGVCKQWTKQIFNSQNHEKPFYIGRMSILIDLKIKTLKFPSLVTRMPPQLTHLDQWKASDFRNWLLFTSLPCISGFLPNEYVKHHCLLVDSIYTLCKSHISHADINRARLMLKLYCSKYAQLYGETEMSYNLHQLLHYSSSVEFLGPLWAHNTFAFEKANDLVRTSIQGTKDVAKKLVNTFNIYNSLHAMIHLKELGDNIIESENFIDKIELLGPKVIESQISAADFNSINIFCISTGAEVQQFHFFSRCRVERFTYTSSNYLNVEKSCSYYVAYKTDHCSENQWAKVLAYFNVNKKYYFFGKKVKITATAFVGLEGFEVQHLKKFEICDDLIIHEVKNIVCPLYNILDTLSEPPNMFEFNL